MRFGLDIAQQRAGFREVVDRARFAEHLGFTGVWGFDHFVPMYGDGPGECFDGMTTLAALATATDDVRLGLMVAGVTYRLPSIMANQALTIDHASGGRFDFAIGAAWYEDEHRAFGIPFPSTRERFDLLTDQLEIYTRLMTGDEVSYEGRRISLHHARQFPLPVQRPYPPIWIGGSGPKRTLPLVARYADCWHTKPGTLAELRDRLDQLCAEADRDPATITKASSLSLDGTPDEIRADIEARIGEGFEYLHCGWPGAGRDQIAVFAAEVMGDYA